MRGRLYTLLVLVAALLIPSAQAITITSQPKPFVANAGSTATFSVTTTNGTVTSYQWLLGTTLLQDGTTSSGAIISGSQTPTLTIENVGTNLNGSIFKVAISNTAAPIVSAPARLTVLQGTIVKFNTSLGAMVVELFDHDKPVTVENFLRYAKSTYEVNTIFTRLEQNFVLQGGGYRPHATSGADQFTNVEYIADTAFVENFNKQPAFPGYTVNESHKGPRIHNTFGTLAMATLSGFPDTARAEWFFNLADNSTNLDEPNGGYTVFGRVVSGTDVLNTFNTLPSDQIVSDTVSGVTFPTLPLLTNNSPILVSNLVFAGVSVLSHPVIDTTRPIIRITNPVANARLTNTTFTLRGTASDNVGVSSVICTELVQFGVASDSTYDLTRSVNITGTTNWSANLVLNPGPWGIVLRVYDGYGNWSQIVETFTILDPLTVQTDGLGTIIPNLNGKWLAPQTRYSMTAVPRAGQLFAGWTAERAGQPWTFPFGTWSFVQVVTNGQTELVFTGPQLGSFVKTPTLSFLMNSNLVITAHFVSNYFPVVQGTYYGLVAPTDHNNITVSNAGLAKISSTAAGTFTGSLSMQNKVFPFAGKWDYAGNANFSIARPGTTPLAANLSIDLSNGVFTVNGTVQSADWTSDITTTRSVTKLTASTIPAAGKYVMKIPTTTSDLGDSVATMTASPGGILTFAGLMADNTPWTETVGVDKDGNFPIFCSLYSGRGLLIGLQQFSSVTNSIGATRWIRPAITTAFYTNGFSTPAFNSYISGYGRPAANTTYGLQFGGNTLQPSVSYGLTINNLGQFQITSGGGPGDHLVLTLTPTTGALSGTWSDPALGTWTIKGVLGIFNNPNIAGTGFVLGPHGQTGSMQLFFGP